METSTSFPMLVIRLSRMRKFYEELQLSQIRVVNSLSGLCAISSRIILSVVNLLYLLITIL